MKRFAIPALLAVALAAHTVSAPPAAAVSGPNLATSITAPPPTNAYATGRYTVTVANVGNQHANNSSVTITLPLTNTSPQAYVMGILGARSANCSLANNRFTCNLGQVRRNRSTSVFFDIALPQSSAPIVVSATSSTAGDTNTNNDTAQSIADVRYVNVAGYPTGLATNRHCTGQGLTAFYECTLFPSSISSHTAEFLGSGSNGTIIIPGHGTYTGAWALSGTNGQHLSFQYYDGGMLVASFEGDGVRSTATTHCYEGLTTFNPPSPYVAPYEVCF